MEDLINFLENRLSVKKDFQWYRYANLPKDDVGENPTFPPASQRWRFAGG